MSPFHNDKQDDHMEPPAWSGPLCALIAERTGIKIYEHQLIHLYETVKEACQYFGYLGPLLFLQALNNELGLSPELEFLVCRITVGESYFFRNPSQMNLLKNELLPDIIQKKRLVGDLSLRIWSAGCSGGQEIYSLAIFLNELLPDISHWKLYLLATDINTVALTEARRACYTNWSFRETSPYFLKKYFIESNNKYIVNESIQRLVTFSYLNLANDIFPSLLTNTNAMDLILCRNVLIYIEPTMARQIMNRFIACLMPQGILLTGPSDHVEVPTDLLERVQLADASYYRKRLPVSFDTDALNPSIVKKTPTATEDISQQQSRVIPLHEPFPDVLPVFNKQLLLLNQTGCWHDILIACDQGIRKFGATAHFLQLKANALANIGHMDEALQTCKMSLEKDPLEKHTYLIQGLILVEQGALVEAESVFHKALYLDHQFLLAHYQLALLLLKIGKHSLAIKSFNNALVLAEQGDPRKEIEGAPGVTFEHFTDILRKEILIYLEAKS